jgi:hypothetical protein
MDPRECDIQRDGILLREMMDIFASLQLRKEDRDRNTRTTIDKYNNIQLIKIIRLNVNNRH